MFGLVCLSGHWDLSFGWQIVHSVYSHETPPPGGRGSPVRYAKFESIRYFIDIDILQNCLIDIDIFQNHHIDIDIDIDIFGITLSISISISIFFRIALSISISISIFSTSPYRYRYRYRYFSKVSIYRQSIFPIDILTRRRSKKNIFYRCTWGRSNKMCFTGAKKMLFLALFG